MDSIAARRSTPRPLQRLAAAPVLGLLVLAAGAAAGSAQAPVRYAISFENRAHHEAEITVTFAELPDAPLELRMSRTSPGRYALHEFAKNVYNFRATGAGGRAVAVSRPNNHQWDVAGHGGSVTVSYTLYGDRADGTYTGIDRTHGHLNMPATFLWARGFETRPVELQVRVPEGSGWRVATQLAPTNDPFRFTAPDLQYFLDSPTEASDFWQRTWEVDGQRIRVALHHAGTEAEAEAYARDAGAIVEASRDVYGELPTFDHGEYVFLACYLPWVDGDGMEHRNSTILTSSGSLESNRLGLLGTVAHEFFHAWNVERIRPASLEPFDFEEANMSRELWFAEGFTSYYDDLILWRSGLIDDAGFATRMGGLAHAVTNAPGRRYFSATEMSMQAPFIDAATSVDPTNTGNTFFSYYTWGAGIGLALDLTLRTRFQEVTLDHLMREMWRAHGVDERPYDVEDVEAALARVTGDPIFARDFFDRYVRGREAADYPGLLASAGIDVERRFPGRAWADTFLPSVRDGVARLSSTPTVGSPFYEAGLDRDDTILAIAGREIGEEASPRDILEDLAPGDRVSIRFGSRGSTFETEITLQEHPMLAGSLSDGATAAQRAFLARWKEAAR